MPRIIRIVTSSLGTFEAVSPPFNIREPEAEENINIALSILESAAAYKPDLVVLPETFKLAGMGTGKIKEIAEPISGPTVQMLSEKAREGNHNLIAGHMLIDENGKFTNSALVFDRQGNLVGKYDKNYPVESEIDFGIQPGTELPIFNLDIGRVGVLICFDINWPAAWKQLAEAGAELIAWVSAYEGGFPLRSLAWTNQVPIVTSVMPYHGRVIDITGEILASTSRWSRIANLDLNLDRGLYHTDNQMQRIAEIQTKYGADLAVKTFTEEHLILMENRIQGKTVDDIAQEFGLVPYKDYIAYCTEVRRRHLG